MLNRLSTLNRSALTGLVGGVVLVLGMMLVVPAHIGAFFDIPGLIVVLGGTLAATCVSRPLSEVWRVLRSIPALMREAQPQIDADIRQLLRIAEWCRHGNYRAAERELPGLSNDFLRKGMRLVVDGTAREEVARLLQWRIAGHRAHDQSDAQILRTMAAFAPAFGMLGTLFGLVHMLYGIGDSGLQEIGGSMAFALITTLYGIVIANMFCKPLAMKMERNAHQRQVLLNMLLEGVLLVHDKRHPTIIRETLDAYLVQQQVAVPPMPAALSLVKV